MATKKQIIADLNALISAEVSEETLAAVNALLLNMGTKAAASGFAKDIELDGTDYRWCNRHNRYEPIDWFMVEKDGKVKPECAAAYYQWVKYGKDINKAIKAADGAEIGRLTLLRKNKNGYDLATDLETHAKSIEEALSFTPALDELEEVEFPDTTE